MTSRLAALLLLAAAGCATGSAKYLAKVNDETITGRELRLEFSRSHNALEKILGDEAEVRKYLDRLVDRRLFVQEGYRIGLQDSPEVREGVERVRTQRIVELFLKDEVEVKVKVTDEDVRAVHEQLGEPVEARQVVVATQAEANALRAAVAGGANLEVIAREKSIAPSTKQGGMLVIAWGADEAYEKAVLGLKDGELSPVFQTENGWEFVRVEGRKKVARPPLEKVAPQIRRILERRGRMAREEQLYGELWSKYEARLLDCAPTVESLREAAAKKDSTPCATWRGGGVTAEAVARRVKIEKGELLAERWPVLRKPLIEDLVNRELVLLEATARGYGERPEVAEKVKARRDELVEGMLFREYVVKGIEPSDADARRHYDAHPDAFAIDAQVELAQILVASEETAAEVAAKLKTGQPFAELAAAYTTHEASAKEGGRVGFIERRRLTEEFAPVAALAEGEVSAPIRSKEGFHIVKVLGTKPGRMPPFEEVKEEARKLDVQARRKAATDKWVATLKASARIEISDAGIRAYSRERTEAVLAEREADQKKAEAARAAAAANEAAAKPAPTAPAPAPAPAPTGATAPSPSTPPPTAAPTR